jgi:hypothetical protein
LRWRWRGAGTLVVILAVILVAWAPAARAASERLVLGSRDAELASALSVAVSPRGLSVVELPEPLVDAGLGDLEAARREVSVPGTVAVVWLCDDEAGAHALCFCGGDGHLTVKPISVSAPLSPPDAAALALSVKVLLGAPPRPAPAPGPPQASTPPPSAPARPVPSAPTAPPELALELAAGARLQPIDAQRVAFRVGLRGAFAPAALGHRLGVGAGLETGPGLASGGEPPPAPSALSDRRVSDSTLAFFVRGRMSLAPLWLELDVGPSVHWLSVASGASAPRRTELSLDALAGLVMPLGRTFVGVRAGGFRMMTSATGFVDPLALPRSNGQVLLTLGLAFR